jgi:UDP-N-acetylmuramoyl-tripeptide--D-alanyl-D-alanine ligase
MWKSEEIIKATTGTTSAAPFAASSVSIDSRTVKAGAIYIALKGERVDGHDYVKEALAAGAVCAIVHTLPAGVDKNAPLVMVNDTYKALVDLANAARRRTKAKIAAVTGSVGKTGTKEALRTVLSSAGAVYATQGNFNNHIGLPLSLANLPLDANFCVLELGMNHSGEISFLSRIAKPELAIITNIEAVHLEYFSGLEAIADAKAEILEGMPQYGTIILNRDNLFYERLAGHAQERGIANIMTFGANPEADCRLLNYATDETGSQIEANICGTPITYHMGTVGQHWAMTSLSVLAAVTALKVDLANSAATLAHFHEPDGRGRLHRVVREKGAMMVIDDSYNASPTSVKAAIVKLAELHKGIGRGRKIAVLGDMLELGSTSADLHKELLATLVEQQIDKVYATGLLMKHLYDILPSKMQGAHTVTSALLAPMMREVCQADDIVLVKGSHGSRMDIVRDVLLAPIHHNIREQADAL